MTTRRALQVVFAISLVGVGFSGVLTYGEFFGPGATQCPAPGAPGTVLGYPACVYGFFMYLTIAIVSAVGLWSGRATGAAATGQPR